jgi:hypothetical protein
MGRFICAMIIVGLFFSDFLILSLGLSVTGAWKEALSFLLLGWLILVLVVKAAKGRAVHFKYVYLVVIVCVFSAVFLLCGDFSESSVRSFRALSVPVFLGFIVVFLLEREPLDIKLRWLLRVLLLCSLCTGIYGAYQFLTIKDPVEFWYWVPLVEKGFVLQPTNSMRDGLPRMAGFFTGTLEFSAVVLNCAILVLSVIFASISRRKINVELILLIVTFLVFTLLIIFGSVRTSLIGLISLFFFLVLTNNIRNQYLLLVLGYGYFVSLSLVIFLYLTLGFTDDPSALDRPRQWLEVLSFQGSHPLGYGLGEIGPGQAHWFDSFWLNLIAGCGVFGVAMMLFLVLFYGKIVKACTEMKREGTVIEAAFGMYIMAIYPFYLSSFFFQAYTNSVVLYLFAITLLVVMYERRFRVNQAVDCSGAL